MKITSSTSRTSIIGVMLISALAVSGFGRATVCLLAADGMGVSPA